MKQQVQLTSALFALSTAVTLPAYASQSSIDSVTIYQGSAAVVRSQSIKPTGEQMVVFDCLSANLDVKSINLAANKSVNIGEISIQQLPSDKVATCQQTNSPLVKKLQDRLAAVDADIHANQLVLDYLKNLGKSPVTLSGSGVGNASTQVLTKAKRSNLALYKLKQEKAQLETKLAASLASNDTNKAQNLTQVAVRVASNTAAKLQLSYQVSGASWQPSYKANLNSKLNTLKVDLEAIMAQTTGENWQDAKVTLTTAQPSYRTSSPLPYQWRLSLYEKESKISRQSKAYAPAPVAMLEQAADMKVQGNNLPRFDANVTNKAGIIEYRLPQRINLPSDGRKITTRLDSQRGSTRIWLRATPSLELAAYWYADASFLTKDWLAGSMYLYRDNIYVGEGRFDKQNITEKGLGFGRHAAIVVKRITNETKQSKEGLFGGNTEKTIEQSYRIENKDNKRITIEVLDQAPIAADTAITVASTYVPQPQTQRWLEQEGNLKWEFNIPAYSAQTYSTKHVIRYPKDKILR